MAKFTVSEKVGGDWLLNDPFKNTKTALAFVTANVDDATEFVLGGWNESSKETPYPKFSQKYSQSATGSVKITVADAITEDKNLSIKGLGSITVTDAVIKRIEGGKIATEDSDASSFVYDKTVTHSTETRTLSGKDTHTASGSVTLNANTTVTQGISGMSTVTINGGSVLGAIRAGKTSIKSSGTAVQTTTLGSEVPSGLPLTLMVSYAESSNTSGTLKLTAGTIENISVADFGKVNLIAGNAVGASFSGGSYAFSVTGNKLSVTADKETGLANKISGSYKSSYSINGEGTLNSAINFGDAAGYQKVTLTGNGIVTGAISRLNEANTLDVIDFDTENAYLDDYLEKVAAFGYNAEATLSKTTVSGKIATQKDNTVRETVTVTKTANQGGSFTATKGASTVEGSITDYKSVSMTNGIVTGSIINSNLGKTSTTRQYDYLYTPEIAGDFTDDVILATNIESARAYSPLNTAVDSTVETLLTNASVSNGSVGTLTLNTTGVAGDVDGYATVKLTGSNIVGSMTVSSSTQTFSSKPSTQVEGIKIIPYGKTGLALLTGVSGLKMNSVTGKATYSAKGSITATNSAVNGTVTGYDTITLKGAILSGALDRNVSGWTVISDVLPANLVGGVLRIGVGSYSHSFSVSVPSKGTTDSIRIKDTEIQQASFGGKVTTSGTNNQIDTVIGYKTVTLNAGTTVTGSIYHNVLVKQTKTDTRDYGISYPENQPPVVDESEVAKLETIQTVSTYESKGTLTLKNVLFDNTTTEQSAISASNSVLATREVPVIAGYGTVTATNTNFAGAELYAGAAVRNEVSQCTNGAVPVAEDYLELAAQGTLTLTDCQNIGALTGFQKVTLSGENTIESLDSTPFARLFDTEAQPEIAVIKSVKTTLTAKGTTNIIGDVDNYTTITLNNNVNIGGEVTGTAGADKLTVAKAAVVTIGGETMSFGDGNDTVTLNGTVNFTNAVNADETAMIFGDGNDVLDIKAGGSLTVDTLSFGDGDNKLTIAKNGQATVANLNFGEGSSVVTLQAGAQLTVTDDFDLYGLEKFSLAKNATLTVATEELAQQIRDQYGSSIKGTIVALNA